MTFTGNCVNKKMATRMHSSHANKRQERGERENNPSKQRTAKVFFFFTVKLVVHTNRAFG